MPDDGARSTKKVALGFLLGLILSAICFVIAVVVGLALRIRPDWMFPVLNALLLILAALYFVREYHESDLAKGVVIALAFVFLGNGICGIGWMH